MKATPHVQAGEIFGIIDNTSGKQVSVSVISVVGSDILLEIDLGYDQDVMLRTIKLNEERKKQ